MSRSPRSLRAAPLDTSTINCDNPLLSAQQLGPSVAMPRPIRLATLALYIGRRNTEGGGRQQSFQNYSFRILLGVRGAIYENWDYDTSAQYSKVEADQRANNYFHNTRLTRALDVHGRSVNTGAKPTCRVGSGRLGSELRAL